MDWKVTYGRIVCDIKPHKGETHKTILAVGVNLVDYTGEVTTPTAYITAAKTLIDSTISTPDARFLCEVIASFYLNTPMDRYKYIQITFNIITKDTINGYNTTEISHNGKVYI